MKKSKDGPKRTPVVVHLNDTNDTWLRSIVAESGSSIAKVVNAMMHYLQDHPGFVAPKHVPAKVLKAQETLRAWQARSELGVSAMPQAIAAAEVKRRGRPKRTGNDSIAERS